jgi:hypothetical protein
MRRAGNWPDGTILKPAGGVFGDKVFTGAQLKTWRILFTDYGRAIGAFASSYRAANGPYFFQREFRINLLKYP